MGLSARDQRKALALPEGRKLLEFELAAHTRLLGTRPGAERRQAFREIYAEWPLLMEGFSMAFEGKAPEALGYSSVVVDWCRPWLTGRRVLEIGCGAGAASAAISRVAAEVVGVDVSKPLLEKAAARKLPRVVFELGDVTERLAFADQSFDAVYWNDVAEHLHPDDLGLALAEIRRLLRPGGHLCTITCHIDDGPHDLSCLVQPPGSSPLGMHLQEFTSRSWARAVRRAGFVPRLPFVGVNALWKARAGRLLPPLMVQWAPVELVEGSALSRASVLVRWLAGANVVFSVAEKPR